MMVDTAMEVAPGVREAGTCTAAPRAEEAVARNAGIGIAVTQTGKEFGAETRLLPVAGNAACPVAETAVGEVDEQGPDTMGERSAEEPADTLVVLEWAAKHILRARKQDYKR